MTRIFKKADGSLYPKELIEIYQHIEPFKKGGRITMKKQSMGETKSD